MLIRYFQQMACQAAEVEAILTREPAYWLGEIASGSSARGTALTTRVGLNVGIRRLDHEVIVTVSEPRRLGETTVVPIRWSPARGAATIPSLDGDLEVAPMGDGLTQLAISASYTPPLGWLGAVADRALMRRVAEATVKDFLDQVAMRIEEIIVRDTAKETTGPAQLGTSGPER